MDNPIVVFVRKADCGDDELVFPTGWAEDGQRLNGVEKINGRHCCVILLDDTAPVEDCPHSNKDSEKPLPVILHRRSNLHSARHVAVRNPNLANLQPWGRLAPRQWFSHDRDGDAIFGEILALLREPSTGPGFARKYGAENDLDVLDALAAICQTVLIARDGGAIFAEMSEVWYDAVNTFSDQEFIESIESLKDWKAKLRLIGERANSLSERLPG